MHFWTAITTLGDSGVMVPVAALIALWLGTTRHPRLAARWCVAVGAVGAVVALSKLLFMGWCFGFRSIDFTGISGHSAMAAVVLPVLTYLLAQAFTMRPGAAGWMAGALIAILVSVSRLAVHVHSPSEVAAGLLLGLTLGHWFLQAAVRAGSIAGNPRVAGLSLLLLPGLLWLQPAPTQTLLERIAMLVSGQRAAFTREAQACDLQPRQAMRWPALQPDPPSAPPSAEAGSAAPVGS